MLTNNCKNGSNVSDDVVDSTPSLGVIIVDCLSDTLLFQIDSSSLYLDGIEPFLGRKFSVWHSTKRCSSIFDLVPLSPAQDLLPKIFICGSLSQS